MHGTRIGRGASRGVDCPRTAWFLVALWPCLLLGCFDATGVDDATTDAGPALDDTRGAIGGEARRGQRAGAADGPVQGHGGIRVEIVGSPWTTLTAEDGHFLLEASPGTHDLRFSAPGYGLQTASDVTVRAGEATLLDALVVLPGLPGRIEGQIVLPPRFAASRLEHVELALRPSDAEHDADPTDRGTPSADGSFIFSSVDPGTWRIDVRSMEFEPASAPARVEPGAAASVGRIQLQYVSPDDPATAAFVEGRARLQGVPGDDGHGGILVDAVGTPFAATTTPDGRFRLVLTPGPQRLRFSRAGYGQATTQVDVPPGAGFFLEDDVVLSAQPGALRGRVAIAQFADAARLQATDVELLDGDGVQQTVSPTAEGLFVLEAVQPGAYVVRARSVGYRDGLREVDVAPGASLDLGEIALRHDSEGADMVTLEGTVGLADAADHGGTRVRAELTGWDLPYREAVTLPDGGFALPASAREIYRLVIDRPGYGPAQIGPVAWNVDRERFEDADGAPIEATLRRAELDGAIEVPVRFAPDWLPADQLTARVRVVGGGTELTAEGVTVRQAARVGVSHAGDYQVVVEREGFAAEPQAVRIDAANPRVVLPAVELRLMDLARAAIDLSGGELDAAVVPAEVNLAGADLSDVMLQGDFSGRDLSGANLANADLTAATLVGALLSRANLFGAELGGVDLSDADLSFASLFAANLEGAILAGADLRFANLTSANLRDAVFVGAGEGRPEPPCDRTEGVRRPAVRLRGVVLANAVLTGTHLAGVDLEGADLSGARLGGTNLAGACLRRAAFSLTDASEADLSRADLRDARLINTVLVGTDLRGADLSGAALLSAILERTAMGCVEADETTGRCTCALDPDAYDDGGPCADPDVVATDDEPGWAPACACRTRAADANFNGANLAGAHLADAHLSGSSLVGAALGDALAPPAWQPFDCELPEGCDWAVRDGCGDLSRECTTTPTSLAGARMDRAQLAGQTFAHVDLRGVRARDANLSGAAFPRSVLTNVDFNGVEAEAIDLSGRDLTGSDLSGAVLRNANLRRTDLRGASLRGADVSGADIGTQVPTGAHQPPIDSRALLQGADLGEVDLRSLGLTRLNVFFADYALRVSGWDLQGANLERANLSGMQLQYIRLNETNLRSADLSGASLLRAGLGGADLTGANLDGASLCDSDRVGLSNRGWIGTPRWATGNRDSNCPTQ